MWDEQKQARFDALRAREETLTRREQKERAALIEELDRAEAASLQPSVEREEAECLRLETQNADLAALLERRQALASKLEHVLTEAKAEDDTIEGELARILSNSEAVSGATTG